MVNRPFEQLALLLFDMDGVLVDDSASYRSALVSTVHRYVSFVAQAPQLTRPISHELIDQWKAAGGFNNDWDLAAGLSAAMLHAGEALGSIARELRPAGGGLDGLELLLGSRAMASVRYNLDMGDPHDIMRIFQEYYLGSHRFTQRSGIQPAHHRGEGACESEGPILAVESCCTLAEAFPLGIATGRPAAEAQDALRRIGIGHCFGAVVSDDDVRAESRRTNTPVASLAKPKAWPVAEARRRVCTKAGLPPNAAAAYVGDLADDMRAGKAAGVMTIGVHDGNSERRNELQAAGCDALIEHPDELLDLLIRP